MKSFQIQFKDDNNADWQYELYEVAEQNGWTVNGAIKIEYLEQMTKLGKEKAAQFNTIAIVKIWENKDDDFDPDPDFLIDKYEI